MHRENRRSFLHAVAALITGPVGGAISGLGLSLVPGIPAAPLQGALWGTLGGLILAISILTCGEATRGLVVVLVLGGLVGLFLHPIAALLGIPLMTLLFARNLWVNLRIDRPAVPRWLGAVLHLAMGTLGIVPLAIVFGRTALLPEPATLLHFLEWTAIGAGCGAAVGTIHFFGSGLPAGPRARDL
jgi:hypothetical protein